MKKQNGSEMNNQESVIEDLTVNEGLAAEVKGGATWGEGKKVTIDFCKTTTNY
ncbi:MAG TPA: hypothetical protein VID27_11670 [Blastocatellia bacterium]|jgi:hypothetical protein